MGKRFGLAIELALLAATMSCAGQDAPQRGAPPPVSAPAKSATPTGASASSLGKLTGTVFCGDTNLPARLANISLLQDSTSSNANLRNIAGSYGIGATTDLEGRFFIDNVPEGRYYVVAIQPGYLNLLKMFADLKLTSASEDDRKAFETLATAVEISASQPAEVSIRLERAAEIDGTVLYDDGSPAVSLLVRATRRTEQPAKNSTESAAGRSMVEAMLLPPATTDDRGQFRILGVAPGEYLVSASLMAFSGEANASRVNAPGGLNVYAGGGFRASKANPVKVGSGDAAVDADITIPLNKLHTIHGHVVLKSTGQPPVAAGVLLLFADTRERARIVYVADGEFEIDSVPEESYILQAVAAARSLLPEANGMVGPALLASGRIGFALGLNVPVNTEFAAEMPLAVTGGVENATISVPDPEAPEQQAQPQAAASVGVGPAVTPVSDSDADDDSK
jgi:hypothetical protein